MTVHVLTLGVKDPSHLGQDSSTELSRIVADWICDVNDIYGMKLDFFTMSRNANAVVCKWNIGVSSDADNVPFDVLISKLHPDVCQVERIYKVPTVLM